MSPKVQRVQRVLYDGKCRRGSSQRVRERPSKFKSVFERAESDIVFIQSTVSLYLQFPETSRLTPASTPAPQAPSIRHLALRLSPL